MSAQKIEAAPDELTTARREVSEALAAVQTECGNPVYAKSLLERFGGPGGTIGTLTADQSALLLGYVRAEARGKEAAAAGAGTVPEALHLCSDQANARRLQAAFGKQLMVVAGDFYAWTGTHWAHDEGEAHRHAAQLSSIVAKEAKRAAAEYNKLAKDNVGAALAALKNPRKSALGSTEEGARVLAAKEKVESLRAWSNQCEMKSRQDAAVGLLRNLLTLDAVKLDSNPWLLNCESGTVDLRTGLLKAHDAKDYITRCCPIKYDPSATAPHFERFVREIVKDDETVAGFLRRWFGYAATGDCREQRLVIHVGPGGNGKGTLLSTITDILGPYAAPAAPGLMADSGRSGERHPAEIADLHGLRLVTAQETGESTVLREDFVKHATGNDELKARRMYGEFFKFKPTHKLQLLTNHKPIIKGQDYGIWRRILLVMYPIKFAPQEDIDAAEESARNGMRLRDDGLALKLEQEREGIFAWIVRGAVEWHRDGLRPPDTVRAAGKDYREEQDRVGTFLKEMCVLDPEERAVFGGDFGLYSTYQQWCRDNGYNHLARIRFLQELEQSVPGFKKSEPKIKDAAGNRKSTLCITGLRLEDVEPSSPIGRLMKQLDADKEVALILEREGLLTAEAIVAAPFDKLHGVLEFNDAFVETLRAKAQEVVNHANA